jgi:hypothetical protein
MRPGSRSPHRPAHGHSDDEARSAAAAPEPVTRPHLGPGQRGGQHVGVARKFHSGAPTEEEMAGKPAADGRHIPGLT